MVRGGVFGNLRFLRSSEEIARLRIELGERKARSKVLEDQLGVREATLVARERACADREVAVTARERTVSAQRDELEAHRSAAVVFERDQTAREQVPNEMIQPKGLSETAWTVTS